MTDHIRLAEAHTHGFPGSYLSTCVFAPAMAENDLEVLGALGAHPNLVDAERQQLLHHPAGTVRAATIRGGLCTLADVEAAISDPDEAVRVEVAAYRDISAATQEVAARDVQAVQLALCDNESTFIEMLRALSDSPDPLVAERARDAAETRGVRRTYDPALLGALDQLIEDMGMIRVNPHQAPTPPAMGDVAGPNGPVRDLDDLINGNVVDRMEAASLPRLPDEVRPVLLNDPDAAVRARYAYRGDLRPDEAAQLANDPEAAVRASTTANVSCPADVRDSRATDPDARTRAGVARHTKDPALWATLADDEDIVVQQLSLQVECLDWDTVAKLARHSDVKVQRQVALNRMEPERLDPMKVSDLQRWKLRWQDRLEQLCPGSSAAARDMAEGWPATLAELATVAAAIA